MGCNIRSKVTPTREYGFQPPIDKLYWGMSLDNIEKVLKIQNGVDGVVYNYDKPITRITLKDKVEVFGYKATVSLEIYDKIDQDWYPYKSSYLNCIILTYDGIDGEKIKDNIINNNNSTGNDWVDLRKYNCTTWLSEDQINDIKPNIKKKLTDLWNLTDERTRVKGDVTTFSVKKDENESINDMLLIYSDKDAVVKYNGDTAVLINKILVDK